MIEKLRVAAQQLLEAWDDFNSYEKPSLHQRIEALRAALAEPEPCQYPECVDNGPDGKCTRWLLAECEKSEDFLRPARPDVPESSFGNLKPVGWFEPPHGAFRANPQYRIRFPSQLLSWQIPLYTHPPKAEPEPAQEPVAVHQFRKQYCANWYDGHPDHTDGGGPYEERTLYLAPPQRPPLTDEEIDALALEVRCDPAALRSAVERAVRGEKE